MNSNQKTILITGSTSYIAKYVVDEILSSTNFNIVLTYRSSLGNYPDNNRITFEKADLLVVDEFENIFEKYKPDYFIHLAAMARVSDGETQPLMSINANFVASYRLIDLCSKFSVNSCLLMSSNLAQGAVSTVGISKFLMEQYVQKITKNQSKFICYRVPNVIDSNGAVTNIFRHQINNNLPITITHPDMSRLFITGTDVGKEILYLLINGKDKGIYVSYKEPTKIIDLASSMIRKSGKEIPINIIGMKPGEKLTEHSFSDNDVYQTDIQYLGLLRSYDYNPISVKEAIDKLNMKEEIRQNQKLQQSLASLF